MPPPEDENSLKGLGSTQHLVQRAPENRHGESWLDVHTRPPEVLLGPVTAAWSHLADGTRGNQSSRLYQEQTAAKCWEEKREVTEALFTPLPSLPTWPAPHHHNSIHAPLHLPSPTQG